MNKWAILLSIVIFSLNLSNSVALKCYVCKTKENAECHDLRDTYIKAQDCTGNLRWNEMFACFVNSSMVNNLIETDRSCLIISGSSDPCLGKTSPNMFGRCRVCSEDECNSDYNYSTRVYNFWGISVINFAVIGLNQIKLY
ncbi:uncharacterized protein [Chironomus tepperi]|uniref:uncharacterized protein n=1 Tax=Chironomus tepperi TaxID=113505 RepID=UPI00391FA5C1